MRSLDLQPEEAEMHANLAGLGEKVYPGRVIVAGLIAGNMAVQLYALMGRSYDSQFREIRRVKDGVRTAAPGMTDEEMQAVPNAALIYYKAMKEDEGIFVVSNGAQTDHVSHRISQGFELETAMKRCPTIGGVNLAEYEPDVPATPRITGVTDINKDASTPFGLSIVYRSPVGDAPIYRTWGSHSLEAMQEGVGYCLHTYTGDGGTDSFTGEPYPVPLGKTLEETAQLYVDGFNPTNLVALVARGINRATGEVTYQIHNDLLNRAA